MYIIIAGAGRVGSEITKIMVNNKHDVVVIDIDPEICNDIYSETGAMTINGNATTIRTLEKAGAEKADAILCLMHSEADNIACSIEHVIKGEAFERFRNLVNSIIECESPDKYCLTCRERGDEER